MKQKPTDAFHPLISRIHQLFNKDLALENDFVRAENRVLRDLLGDKRPKLTERHRRLLVRYGMRIKDRLVDVLTIATPDTLLAWNRRMGVLVQKGRGRSARYVARTEHA